MFSSPLPYTRRPSDDRYTQPLPPPLPASPLRQPQPQQTHAAQGWDPGYAHSPVLHHATSAPAAGFPTYHHHHGSLAPYESPETDQAGRGDPDLCEAIRRSLTIPVGGGGGAGGTWRDLAELQEAQDVGRAVELSVLGQGQGQGETEAERMVRVMSRRGRDRSAGAGGRGVASEARSIDAGWEEARGRGYDWDRGNYHSPGDAWIRGYRQGDERIPGNGQAAVYRQEQGPGQNVGYQDHGYLQNHDKYSSPAPPPRPELHEYPLWPHTASMPLQHHPDTQDPQPSTTIHHNPTHTNTPPTPTKPPHARYIPTLPQLDSAQPSGTTTPCPPYQVQPETSYLDAIPYERLQEGGMRMPAAEDYASIPVSLPVSRGFRGVWLMAVVGIWSV